MLQSNTNPYRVVALYKFVKLQDLMALQKSLKQRCEDAGIMGTVLLAPEGINGTLAGSVQGIEDILTFLKSDPRFHDIEHKESQAWKNPFHRMKVRLKKEIVTLGVPGVDPTEKVGIYVEPEHWNALIQDPEVLLIDTRNRYEYDIGTFTGAINPETQSFREFPDFVKNRLNPLKHKKVAMMCTGGIRCEKASSYMLSQGFETVYHLKGGILKYLESVPATESLWKGDCFVFDNRVSVDHHLQEGHYDLCHGCRHPITDEHKRSPVYEAGVSCPHCADSQSETNLARARERQKQIVLCKKRGEVHLGSEAQHHKKPLGACEKQSGSETL